MATELRETERRICEKIDVLTLDIKDVKDRLFKDNGNPCLQTKVDRNTRWVSSVTWCFGVLFAAVISAILWLFKE